MHWELWWWPSPKAPKKHKNTQALLQVQHLKHDLIHLLGGKTPRHSGGAVSRLFPGSLQGWRIFKWRFEPLESHHINPGFLKNTALMVYYEVTVWKSHVIRQGYCVFLCGIDRGLTFWIRELGAAQLPCWNRWNFAWRCARIAGSTCSSAKFSQIRMVVPCGTVPLLGKPPHAMLWRFAERTGIFHEILGYIEILLGCFGMCWVSIYNGYLVPWCMLTTTHATTRHGCRAKMLFEMRGTAKPMSHLLRVRIELVDSNRETPLEKIN